MSISAVGITILSTLINIIFGAPVIGDAAHHEITEANERMNSLSNYLPSAMTNSGFGTGFTQSLLLILACELGDRTFFVAAILAMKNSRFTVWAGAISALGAMTVLSALLGKAFPMLLDKKITSALAAFLFLFFGIQLLRDWWRMRNDSTDEENDELVEVENEIADKKSSPVRTGYGVLALLSPIFVKSFSMTALAEWGDRSQIATIALAASKDVYGVIIGGIIGHAICTSLAVIGGRLLATRISERMVTLIGGVLFISFAIITASGKLD